MSRELIDAQSNETATAERRDARRQSFICPAELIEISGSARIAARTADLSLNGCYIDTLNPFPVGTRVRLQLTKSDLRVEFFARVTSCHMASGMGLIFEQITPQQKAALESWLRESSGVPDEAAAFRTAAPAATPESAVKPNARFAARLLKILERKGILTHSEAAELFRDLNS